MSQAAEIDRSRPGLALYAPKDASRLLARVPAVDAVGLEERAASLAKRSIKRESKLWALDLAIRCMDLTTLEGTDTVGKIIAMCAKAIRPNPVDPSIPSVAAVCLYPHLVPVALGQLKGTNVRVASVAGAFPAGLGPLGARLAVGRAVGRHQTGGAATHHHRGFGDVRQALASAFGARVEIIHGFARAFQGWQQRFGFLEQLSDFVDEARILLARRWRRLDLLWRGLSRHGLLGGRLHADRRPGRRLRPAGIGGYRQHRQNKPGVRDSVE